jgi:hypothetical protein
MHIGYWWESQKVRELRVSSGEVGYIRMKWAGHVAQMGGKRNAYRILLGKPEGKRPLGDLNVGGWTILK